MNKVLGLALALSFAAAIACSGGGYAAPNGSIIQNTTLNKDVSTSTAVGGKSGEACVSGLLGIMSSGDASIKAAAAAGGISTVKSVDYKNDNLLGSVLTKTCTIANGD
jgi:hypothetical protein